MARSTYYGTELWRDDQFGVTSATVWLRMIYEDDERLGHMPQKVARGEYPRIQPRMNEFINVLMRSKHGDREDVLKIFFTSLNKTVLDQINPHQLSNNVLDYLRENTKRSKALIFNPVFERVIAHRN